MYPLPVATLTVGALGVQGVHTGGGERLTLHATWGSVSPAIASGVTPQRRFLCDPRWLHWTHPEVREFLAGIGGAAVPGVLPAAWDNYVRSRAVPPTVTAWNAAHPATEPPEYDAEGAVAVSFARTHSMHCFAKI